MRYTKYFVYLSLILSQSYDIMPNAKMDPMLYLKFFLLVCESKKLNLRTILTTFLISVIYLKKVLLELTFISKTVLFNF